MFQASSCCDSLLRIQREHRKQEITKFLGLLPLPLVLFGQKFEQTAELYLGIVEQFSIFVKVAVWIFARLQHVGWYVTQQLNDLLQMLPIFGDVVGSVHVEEQITCRQFESDASNAPQVDRCIELDSKYHLHGTIWTSLNFPDEMVISVAGTSQVDYFEGTHIISRLSLRCSRAVGCQLHSHFVHGNESDGAGQLDIFLMTRPLQCFSCQLDDRVFVNARQDIFWLDVRMDDFALGVQEIQAFQQLTSDLLHVAERNVFFLRFTFNQTIEQTASHHFEHGAGVRAVDAVHCEPIEQVDDVVAFANSLDGKKHVDLVFCCSVFR